MAKNKISEWSPVPANNTDVGGIDIAEGCAPSGINNAIREMMAQIKDQQSGTDADNFTVGGNLSVVGTATGVTPATDDNSTKFATTAYVQNKTSSLGTMSTQNANSVAITGGTATLTSIKVGNGTASSPSIGFSSDGGQDTGIYWGGDGYINFTNNGAYSGSITPNRDLSMAGNIYGSTFYGNGGSLSGCLNNTVGLNNVTPFKALNATYTNTTGKPMVVIVTGKSVAGSANLIGYINSNEVAVQSVYATNQFATITLIVPSGSTYFFGGSSAMSLYHWFEIY